MSIPIKNNLERNKLGIIGHPIRHSLSGIMHKAVFQKLSLPYSYESFDIGEKDLGKFISMCRTDYIGLNVTIPHKIKVMEHLDELSNEACLIGAVNTIKFGNGKAKGYNTDGIGAVRSLKEASVPIKNRKALILGAGGAARAICFQLVLEGAQVSVSNRHKGRAMDLSSDIERKLGEKVDVIDFSPVSIEKYLKHADILINTTPVGMFPHAGESVIPASIIPEDVAVMDTVYNPVETKLLKDAQEKRCVTIDGVGMLVHQGAESLKIWLGIEAPTEVMKKAVLDKLSKT